VLNTDGSVSVSLGNVPSGSSVIFKTGRYGGYGADECDYYWSTYFGEVFGETVTATDVDIQGNMFVTGKTLSANFPVTQGAFQTDKASWVDAYAGRFKQLDIQEWLTFFGGGIPNSLNVNETGLAIKWHPLSKSIYFVGSTGSHDFPLLLEGFANEYIDAQTSLFNSQRGFVVKLDDIDGSLKWSTLFGDLGFQYEAVVSMSILSNGNVVIGGALDWEFQNSTFPTTAIGNQHQQNHGFAFIAEFGMDNNLLWATRLIGGSSPANGFERTVVSDITEGNNNEIYITGTTIGDINNDFIPIGSGTFGSSGLSDGYVMRFSASRAILWSTYLGGTKHDFPNSILFSNNKIVVTGTTYSDDFPVIACDAQGNDLLNDISFNGGACDIFMTKFVENQTNCQLVWGRYFGGTGDDRQDYLITLVGANTFRYVSTGNGSVCDDDGTVIITGLAYDDFTPLLGRPECNYYYPDINQGFSPIGGDAIIIVINSSQQVLFSTYWGGSTNVGQLVERFDIGSSVSIGVNPSNKPFVLIGGQTNSRNYTESGVFFEANIPVCHETQINPYFHEDFLGGNYDGFISKIYLFECLSTDLIDCPTSSVQEISNTHNSIIVFPNPVSDLLTVRFDNTIGEVALVRILDLTGKVIGVNTPNFFENKMEVTVPVHNLANGVYQIVLYGLNGDIVGGIFVKM